MKCTLLCSIMFALLVVIQVGFGTAERVSTVQIFEKVAAGDINWLVKHFEEHEIPEVHDGRSILSVAARSGRAELVKLFLSKKVDVNKLDSEGRSALLHAAISGHKAIVVLLIKHGADIDQVDFLDYTPLMWAIRKGHIAVAEVLIEGGADVRYINGVGISPIILAAARGQKRLIPQLISRGANPHAIDQKRGKSALDYATNAEVIKLMK